MKPLNINKYLYFRDVRNPKLRNKQWTQYFLADNPDLVYNLRPRKRNKTLMSKSTELNNRNFLLRMLYRESWLLLVSNVLLIILQYWVAFCQAVLYKYNYDDDMMIMMLVIGRIS